MSTRKATESLIQSTVLNENSLFNQHDHINDLDWEKIWAWVEVTDVPKPEMSLIWFLGFLDGQNDYNLESTFCLDHEDLLAILESLKIEWSGVELQENL